jgi:pilus assembly protein FimV
MMTTFAEPEPEPEPEPEVGEEAEAEAEPEGEAEPEEEPEPPKPFESKPTTFNANCWVRRPNLSGDSQRSGLFAHSRA